MSRSRSRNNYDDYDNADQYLEQVKNRRNNKLKKIYDRETVDNEETEVANIYDQK